MNDGEDLFLLLGTDAYAVKRLPNTAVRTDRSLVVCPRQSRWLHIGIPTQRADADFNDIGFHLSASLALNRNASVSFLWSKPNA